MIWFTSDLHLLGTSILEREERPFEDAASCAERIINNINIRCRPDDTLYIIGDCFDYEDSVTAWTDALAYLRQIKCKTILIMGNHEYKLLAGEFNGNFGTFKEEMLSAAGFADVLHDYTLDINGERWYLNHFPSCSMPLEDVLTLFGHIHHAGGLYRYYGLNMMTDMHNFMPYNIEDLRRLRYRLVYSWRADFELNNSKTQANMTSHKVELMQGAVGKDAASQ